MRTDAKKAAPTFVTLRGDAAGQVFSQRIELAGQFGHEPGHAVTFLGGGREFLLQFLEAGLAAIQAAMYSRVEMPANDSASGYQQHAVERNLAIERAELEIAVIQDEQWADQAQYHVEPEPHFGGPEDMEHSNTFA